MARKFLALSLLLVPFFLFSQALDSNRLELMDIFDLEYISDPQISPDGEHVVYVRNFKDVMTDGNRSNLWISKFDGSDNHPLTTGNQNDRSPRWSPDGKKLAYLTSKSGSTEIYLRWMENGAESKLTNLTESPGNIQWSPDGKWIAFTMSVEAKSEKTPVSIPQKPDGAKWADAPKYIDRMKYRADGAGYLDNSYPQLFVLSADGGHPRRLTEGDYAIRGAFSWTPDSQSLVYSSNKREDRDYEPIDSEIYKIDFTSGKTTQLTDRRGPDSNPVVSPKGDLIAYTGRDERYQGYQLTRLYVMGKDGKTPRLVSTSLDRDVEDPQWAADGSGLFFIYDNEGDTRIAFIDLNGKVKDLTDQVGGLSLGRPYSGGSFSVSKNGRYAFTHTTTAFPAELAVSGPGQPMKRLTHVNDDLFGYKKLGEVEEIWYESSADGRRIQGWICKPPGFDPSKKYPLMLEIHGGPFTNYGSRFSTEIQLYAAAGYVVLYTNPRGSTSYGEEFGNLIHHAYPSQDYDDLISGVDAVIAKGYIDSDELFVTGGSGGGVLTAWIIGKTDRFRAAVVAKPVINWASFVLHSDNPAFFYKYWFPTTPWEDPDHYWKRSPLSLVGNVKTPTLLLTGEQDYRTPISETEQYYAALQINKVPSAMVRIQESGHGIANRPSNLMNKVAYVLGWFEKYRKPTP